MADWWNRVLAVMGKGKSETDVGYDPVNQDDRDGGTPGPGGSDLAGSSHQKPKNWKLDDEHRLPDDAP